MQVEIITIGDEILIGQTVDTNSAWLGQELNAMGVSISEIRSIKDERDAIYGALKDAIGRAKLVLMTGGLGPTQDDITKQVLCEFFETELVMNQEVLERISAFFKERGRQMIESNRQQAALPRACTVLENNLGTASGMWFEKGGTIFVSMPGVPYEMKGLMINQVFPRIKAKFQLPSILHKTIMTEGIGESFLVEIIKDWEKSLAEKKIKIAYLPSPGIVKIRLSMFGDKQEELEEVLSPVVEDLESLIPSYLFSKEERLLEQVLGDLLVEKGKTVVTAESCTGGYLAHLLSKEPGSSAFYLGSIISYSNAVKKNQLGVSSEDIEKYGAVSKPVVEQMAVEAREGLKADFALASSGIAGPDGGSEDKPVGTVWIALAYPGGVYSKSFLFEQNRERNIRRSSYAALSLLRRKLSGILD